MKDYFSDLNQALTLLRAQPRVDRESGLPSTSLVSVPEFLRASEGSKQ
jgi:hypothetical protein